MGRGRWPWFSPPVGGTERWADLEDRIARDERGGVAVGAEAEMDEVELLGQRGFVLAGGRLEVALGDRHRAQR